MRCRPWSVRQRMLRKWMLVLMTPLNLLPLTHLPTLMRTCLRHLSLLGATCLVVRLVVSLLRVSWTLKIRVTLPKETLVIHALCWGITMMKFLSLNPWTVLWTGAWSMLSLLVSRTLTSCLFGPSMLLPTVRCRALSMILCSGPQVLNPTGLNVRRSPAAPTASLSIPHLPYHGCYTHADTTLCCCSVVDGSPSLRWD